MIYDTNPTVVNPVMIIITSTTGVVSWQTDDGQWHERDPHGPVNYCWLPTGEKPKPEPIFIGHRTREEALREKRQQELLKLQIHWEALDAQAALRRDSTPKPPQVPREARKGLSGRPAVRNRVCGGSARYRVML